MKLMKRDVIIINYLKSGGILWWNPVVSIVSPFRAMAIAPPAVAQDSELRLVGGSRPNNNRLRLARHCLMR